MPCGAGVAGCSACGSRPYFFVPRFARRAPRGRRGRSPRALVWASSPPSSPQTQPRARNPNPLARPSPTGCASSGCVFHDVGKPDCRNWPLPASFATGTATPARARGYSSVSLCGVRWQKSAVQRLVRATPAGSRAASAFILFAGALRPLRRARRRPPLQVRHTPVSADATAASRQRS